MKRIQDICDRCSGIKGQSQQKIGGGELCEWISICNAKACTVKEMPEVPERCLCPAEHAVSQETS